MRKTRRRQAASRLLRPLARAVDGMAHNGERRMLIRRYRRVACVALAAERHHQSGFDTKESPLETRNPSHRDDSPGPEPELSDTV